MSSEQYFIPRPDVNPQIYAYELIDVATHEGYLKIGFTDRDVETRVAEQMHTSAVDYRIVLVESAMRSDGSCFKDHDVHAILKRRGIQRLKADKDKNEWYRCDTAQVLLAIDELRTGKVWDGQRTATFGMRPEQEHAVTRAMDYYAAAKADEPNRIPKFLWNAKMRFGKTFASYQLAKKMGFTRILVLTFKPAVESAWQEDLMTHVDFEGWQFISNKDAHNNNTNMDDQFAKADKDKPIVVFGSFQDLLGTNESGGIKAKNEFIHAAHWDIVIFDEYHFGAWRDNAKKLFSNPDEEADVDFDQEKYQKEEAGNAYNESWIGITTDHYLYLSGTPFRAINSGEFIEDQIFNWTYSDEQRAKAAWLGSNNPYAALPQMIMLTYRIPESIRQIAMQGEYNEFDLNVFFSADGQGKKAKFKYENEVQKWLNLIRGAYLPSSVDDMKLGQDKRPPMPYSDTRLLNLLSHTLWFLPNVASCYAMKNLLEQKQNVFYHDYKISVCAGAEAGVGLDALAPILQAMGNPLKTKTITLSCGKLTTGVTVKPWTGIFMLRNLKSPETYFQAAFRVQSPWEITDDQGKRQIIKEKCYVFDFALDRALRQVSDYSCRLNVEEGNPEVKVAEFINFLPVIAYDGSTMRAVNAQDILDITLSGTSATLLAKRWESALLVNVDNETLTRLINNKEALAALMRVEGFRSLNSDILAIINKSEHVKKAKKEGGAQTQKEKKELTEEEKKYKSLRKQIQEKLIKFATRIPVFMYLTDYRERCLKDVITQIEPELFKKVTGLNVNDFNLLCSIGVFNASLMNDAIFKFKRYEDASLSYTGIDKNADKKVGGWDSAITRQQFDAMFAKQQESITFNFNEAVNLDHEDESLESATKEDAEATPNVGVSPVTKVASAEPSEKKGQHGVDLLSLLEVGAIVVHQTFGDGTVVKLDKAKKYLDVTFGNNIYKKFAITAFELGFLTLKKDKE